MVQWLAILGLVGSVVCVVAFLGFPSDQASLHAPLEEQATQAVPGAQAEVARAAAAAQPGQATQSANALFIGTSPQATVASKPPDTDVNASAADWCAAKCRSMEYCCNDHTVGSNSLLSCAQACMLRASGITSPKCNEHCTKQATCKVTIPPFHFDLCLKCLDMTDDYRCIYGVPDEGPCQEGCALTPFASGTQKPADLPQASAEPPRVPGKKWWPASPQQSWSYEQTLRRMQYWATSPSLTPRPLAEKYLIHDNDDGGPNNIRIGWEYVGVVAQETGRTFVLPPSKRMYLLDFGPMNKEYRRHVRQGTSTKVEDLINLEQLRFVLPTMTWAEFEAKTGLNWEQASKSATQVADSDRCNIKAYLKVSNRILFMPGHKRREGFHCGEWWSRGGPKDDIRKAMQEGSWAVLTHGFVWHQDMFHVAARAVQHLGIFDYVALHARYNDFQFKEARQGEANIFRKLAPVFRLAPKLYVASDEPKRFKDQGAKHGLILVTLDDLLATVLADLEMKFGSERRFKLLGPVEELICTHAKVFVGSWKSSFSGHIHRMRIHTKAPESLMINHMKGMSVQEVSKAMSSWNKLDAEYERLPLSMGDRF